MANAKSVRVVFLIIFLAGVTTLVTSTEKPSSASESSIMDTTTTTLRLKHRINEETPRHGRATAKELIARRKSKASIRHPGEDEYTKISKIHLKNRTNPEILGLHETGLSKNQKLQELEEKIKTLKSRISHGPILASNKFLPESNNLIEKIREKHEEIRKTLEAKHEDFEKRLKIAHLKFPTARERKSEVVLGSRNSFPRDSGELNKRHAGHTSKSKPNDSNKKSRNSSHGVKTTTTTSTTTEKPVIILDHRNGESKIKTTPPAEVAKDQLVKTDSATTKQEGAFPTIEEKRLANSTAAKEMNRNKDGTLKIIIE